MDIIWKRHQIILRVSIWGFYKPTSLWYYFLEDFLCYFWILIMVRARSKFYKTTRIKKYYKKRSQYSESMKYHQNQLINFNCSKEEFTEKIDMKSRVNYLKISLSIFVGWRKGKLFYQHKRNIKCDLFDRSWAFLQFLCNNFNIRFFIIMCEIFFFIFYVLSNKKYNSRVYLKTLKEISVFVIT
jgi:hypothetical protein